MRMCSRHILRTYGICVNGKKTNKTFFCKILDLVKLHDFAKESHPIRVPCSEKYAKQHTYFHVSPVETHNFYRPMVIRLCRSDFLHAFTILVQKFIQYSKSF